MEVDAYNYEYVEASCRHQHRPAVGDVPSEAPADSGRVPSDEEKGLIVGVEMRTSDTGRQDERMSMEVGGKTYQIWRQVDSFASRPRTLMSTPSTASKVRSPWPGSSTGRWRRVAHPTRGVRPPWAKRCAPVLGRSGGAAGNVAAHSLDTVWVDPDTGVRLEVANPDPAGGGYDAESVPEALQRGPQELYSLDRGAITGRDFERLAMQKGVARERPWPRPTCGTMRVRALWRYGPRPTCQI